MVNIRVLLSAYSSTRMVRRHRRELMQFADALNLFLSCGFELSYCWNEAIKAVKQNDRFSIIPSLRTKEVGMVEHLRKLSLEKSLREFSSWFGVLENTYQTGAPLMPVVRAMSNSLRSDQAREFEDHSRNLPTKANVLLLVFFLPPALLLIFAPLMAQFEDLMR